MAYFSSPLKERILGVTINEILNICGTIAAVHAKDTS